MDVEALGTIASSANMAFKTPENYLPPPQNQQHVLGCINFSFDSDPIDLSESENII